MGRTGAGQDARTHGCGLACGASAAWYGESSWSAMARGLRDRRCFLHASDSSRCSINPYRSHEASAPAHAHRSVSQISGGFAARVGFVHGRATSPSSRTPAGVPSSMRPESDLSIRRSYNSARRKRRVHSAGRLVAGSRG